MNRDAKTWWLILGLLLILSFGQAGCASSEIEPQCSSDRECSPTETCNTSTGVCRTAIREEENGDNNTPDTTVAPSDTNNNVPDTDDNDPPDVGTQDTGRDTSDPNACDPVCASGTHCESGSCVPDEVTETCTQKGDTCDPALTDQGSFWCAGDGDGGGECLPKCSQTFSANGCGPAEYCWNIGSETEPAPACIESDCQANSDCASGTCLNFDNQFGLCLASGATPQGQSCDPNVSNTCQPGSMCRTEPSGSDTGRCRALCDMWTSPSCPSGQLCDLFSSREGICVPDVDATGYDPYYSCSTGGDMCDHGTPCIGFADGSNACMPYCRPGMGDCPAPSGGQVVCNNYVVASERTWGLCLGACTSNADCSAGPCQNNICRTSCVAGNEVQDCCGGDVDCDWSCVNGLCE